MNVTHVRAFNIPAYPPLDRITGIGAHLTPIETAVLNNTLKAVVHLDAREEIKPSNPKEPHIHIVLRGWAFRYYLTPDGGRQISTIILPGQFSSVEAIFTAGPDAAVVALNPCEIGIVSKTQLLAAAAKYPGIGFALARMAAAENAIFTERIISLGRRAAHERVAHIICELYFRATKATPAAKVPFVFPLTQEQLADILGLTLAHVNRMLHLLRTEGLIELRRNFLTVLDWEGLVRRADFNSSYLTNHEHPEVLQPCSISL